MATLTRENLTKQWLFDTAVEGLASQGFERSVSESGGCRYRGPGGLKCAIGHCVDDTQMAEVKEDMSGSKLIMRVLDLTKDEVVDVVDTLTFADRLQYAHDYAYEKNPEDMKARLRALGDKYGLKIPPVLRTDGHPS